jgi:hypothetical protein
MKSFKQFLSEAPLIIPIPQEMGDDMSKSFIGKPLNALIHRGGQVPRLLKPKAKGKIGDYTFHHASVTDRPIFGDPETRHYMFLAKDGKVVGHFGGTRMRVEKNEKGKSVEHIGLDLAVIHREHRGQDLYAKAIKHFVGKTPHVLYSDTVQSKGAAKAWGEMAKTSEADKTDFRVHPLLYTSNNVVGKGLPRSGELDPRHWEGTPLPGGGELPPEKIRFSIRGRK